MIDAHLHLLDVKRFTYPWCASVPSLQLESRGVSQGVAHARQVGGAVVVEADVSEHDLEGEARFLCDLASARENHIVGVVAGARPEDDGFAAYLGRIAHPKLVGVRRVLHVVHDDVSRSPLFRHNVALLASHDLTFDVCVRPAQLPLAHALIQSAPETRFVLDHAGNPPLAEPEQMAAWQAHLARIAELANVVCKVSGLVNHLPPGADAVATLAPVLAHLLKVFGWSRLLFGSDWPVSTLASIDFETWRQIASELLHGSEASTQQGFFTGNATRTYRLDGPHGL